MIGYTFPQFIHPTKSKELHDAWDVVIFHFNIEFHLKIGKTFTFQQFYKVRTGPYWGSGRELVDNEYNDIILPYQEAKR